MSRRNSALVAGATGMIGANLIRHLDTLADWDVVGLSRRAPNYESPAHFIGVDLLDDADCRDKLSALTHVSHVFFAAYVDRPNPVDQIEPNLRLLTNLLDAVDGPTSNLQHVCIVQGGKYYGRHLGPIPTPARESDPRHMPPNFYFDQEDHLLSRQQGRNWTYSFPRPQAICGYAPGSPINILPVIAVYAVISKELGLPFRFPGTDACYRALYQITDVDLLAKAMVWMATEPKCANQAIHVTNGDVFRWEAIWPRLADYFDMPLGPVQEIRLAQMMADKGPLWSAITEKYNLAPTAFDTIANWPYGDFTFRTEWDFLSDDNKCRALGFHEFLDSEQMFIGRLDELRAHRFIP